MLIASNEADSNYTGLNETNSNVIDSKIDIQGCEIKIKVSCLKWLFRPYEVRLDLNKMKLNKMNHIGVVFKFQKRKFFYIEKKYIL
jgi:hypothetical protein